MDEIRLNKYISEAGICSRREADRLIEAQKVMVDGIIALTGMKVTEGQIVTVNGKRIRKEEERIFLAVNKPKGIVCTAEKREKNNLIDFLNYPKKITYLGRLDKDSTGLILMTNDGEINNKIMRSRNGHEKEYIVEVNKGIDQEFIKKMSEGVPILDTVTKKCVVEQLGDKKFRIILTQGLNRQIRRMCEYLGYKVTRLHRVRIMNITLGDLKPGTYRMLSAEEIKELDRLTNSIDGK